MVDTGAPDSASPDAPESRLQGFWIRTADHERLKAAWWATQTVPTLGAMISEIEISEAARLEREFNDGKPFEPAPRGARGRKAGDDADYRMHSYYIPTAAHRRLLAAWWWTRQEEEGYASVSALMAERILARAEELEREFNGGAPFPPAPKTARGVDPAAARRQSEKLSAQWQRAREARNEVSSTSE